MKIIANYFIQIRCPFCSSIDRFLSKHGVHLTLLKECNYIGHDEIDKYYEKMKNKNMFYCGN